MNASMNMFTTRHAEDTCNDIREVVDDSLARLQEWLDWRFERQEDMLRHLGEIQDSQNTYLKKKGSKGMKNMKSQRTKSSSSLSFGARRRPDLKMKTSSSLLPLISGSTDHSTKDVAVLPSTEGSIDTAAPESAKGTSALLATPMSDGKDLLPIDKQLSLGDADKSEDVLANRDRGGGEIELVSTLQSEEWTQVSHEQDWAQLQEWESKLMAVFDQLDLTRTGSIDCAEFLEAFHELGMPEMGGISVFSSLDKDRNGSIDRIEWLRMLAETDRTSIVCGDDMALLIEFLDRLAERQKTKGRIYDTNRRRRTACVVRHDSLFRMVWDVCMYLSLIYISVSVPYSLGFGESSVLNILDRFTDALFCLDVLLNFRTTYIDQNEAVMYDVSKIARNYFRSWFFIDFISSVPFDLITAGLMPDLSPARLFKIGKVAKVLKLLRMSRMMEFQRHADTELMIQIEHLLTSSVSHRVQRISMLVTVAFFVAHWLACFGSMIDNTGIDYYFREEVPGPTDLQKYLACMYWAMTTLSTVGYGDIIPQSDNERLYAMFAMIIGGSLYGYVVGSVTSIVGDIDANAHAYHERMELIQFWLDRHGELPGTLRRRVRKHFRLALAETSVMEDSQVINELSPELRADTAFWLVHERVRHHPMFSNIQNSALAKLVDVLQKNHVNGNEFVTKKGELGEGMYILVHGIARYYDGTKWYPPDIHVQTKKFQQVREGDSFGEEIIFNWEDCYTYTIMTVMDCEFHFISATAFYAHFQHMPDLIDQMLESVVLHGLVLSRASQVVQRASNAEPVVSATDAAEV